MRIFLVKCVFICLMLNPGQLFAQDLTNISKQKPFSFNGNVELRGIFYNANGIANRMQPYNYLLSGSPTLSIYGWSVPTSFTISKDQRSFQQPFNQFGMSPTYKWITLHAGYRNVTFSPYTLGGHTILGGGVELNPGKFRFGAVHGKLNRATVIDTTSMSLVPYSFDRRGTAIKLGYGSSENFIDVSFLRAKDDSTSAPILPTELRNALPPAANSVFGYASKFTLFKRFFFETDGAVSLLTRNINSDLTIDSIDNKTLRRFANIFHINGTSELSTAFSGGFGYKAKQYGVKINYRRIEPGFTSMGSYFFNNDIENLTISPSYSHPKGKLRANMSLGIEQDNVRLQKDATTKRFIGSGNISSEINERLGVDVNFSNFSNNQRPNTLRFADSLKIVQTTQTLGIMPRYVISSEDKVQMFLISANYSRMNDFNSYFDNLEQTPSRNISTSQYLLSYNISFPKKKFSLNSSFNLTDLSSAMVDNKYTGFSLGGNYMLFDNKLNAGLSLSYILGESNGNKSKIINGSTNITYVLNKLQSIRAMVYFTNNDPGSAITGAMPSFSETRGEIAYQFNFGL